MINYIVQVVLFQVVFLAVYDLFLQKETFFKWNRVYLLATPIISFIVPLLKFESFREAVPQEYVILLPEIMLNPEVIIEQTANTVETINFLNIAFYIGAGLLLLLFLYRLNSILKLIVSNKTVYKESYYLVLLEKKQSAFSFFNFIFIAKDLSEKEEAKIVQHELVHSQHFHSLDLLFFELLKIAMWFNPIVYIYQKRMTLLHEYISDDKVVKATDKKSYFNTLLSQTFNVEEISFVNQFYKHSLIKKRIAMITKNKSKKLKQLKYLVLVPLLGGMLLYSSCETKEFIPSEIESELNQIVDLSIYTYSLRSKEDMIGKTKEIHNSHVDFLINNPKYVQWAVLSKEGEESIITYTIHSKDEQPPKSAWESKIGSDEKFYVAFMDFGKPLEKYSAEKVKEEFDREQFKGKEDVPFAVIDESPTFDGCTGSEEELKSCFNKSLHRHVARKFNADLAGNLNLEPGKKKIYIQFKIMKNGGVDIVGARAPHPDLEKEAKRVVNLLPEIEPGKMFGEPVNVTYMLPISFNVEGTFDPNKEYYNERRTPTSVTSEKRNN